jgi:hypothetical protein
MGEFYRCTYGLYEGEGAGEESPSGGSGGSDGLPAIEEDSKDDTKDNGLGIIGPLKYYNKHHPFTFYDPKVRAYVDDDYEEYDCSELHNGKFYYVYEGAYWRCDDMVVKGSSSGGDGDVDGGKTGLSNSQADKRDDNDSKEPYSNCPIIVDEPCEVVDPYQGLRDTEGGQGSSNDDGDGRDGADDGQGDASGDDEDDGMDYSNTYDD